MSQIIQETIKKYAILLALIPSLIIAQKTNQSLIRIINPPSNDVSISIPIDDMYSWEKAKFVGKSEFLISKRIKEPKFILIKIGNLKYLQSILMPNDNVKIVFDKNSNNYRFKGKNEKYLNLLKSLDRPNLNLREWSKYKHISEPKLLESVISELKRAQLNKLSKIKENPILFQVLEKEIDYYFAQKTVEIIVFKEFDAGFINDELLDLYEKTIKKYPLESKFKPRAWFEYGEIVSLKMPFYKKFRARGKMNDETVQRYQEKDLLNSFNYDIIINNADENILEEQLAYLIYSRFLHRKNEKSLIDLFTRFEIDFPDSKYIKYLKPKIEKIAKIHLSLEDRTIDHINFLDSGSINNWDDLSEKIKGHKYYIDIWATWCGPCIAQFEFNKEVDKLLKDKGYKKLYISIDKPNAILRWHKDIQKYSLYDGAIHLLANESFISDFKKKHAISVGQMKIPQYLITDNSGKIINNHAPRPSNLSELKKHL